MPRRVAVILNPTAGRFRPVLSARIAEDIERRGMYPHMFHTTRRGDARHFAEGAAEAEYEYVLVGGGDGTINEVVNGLAGTRTVMGILPLGTANVLAQEIGIHGGVDGALGLLSWGQTAEVHLGFGAGQHFILMASAGFDANVMESLDLDLKNRRGRWAYAEAAWRFWRRHRVQPALTVSLDSRKMNGSLAVISNAGRYGGRFVLAPRASLFQPELYVTLFHGCRRIDILRYAIALALGCAWRLRDVDHFSGTSVELISAGAERIPIQMDGDVIGDLPQRIAPSPCRLNLLIPPRS